MPRARRDFQPGGIYHLYARGNRRQQIYVDDTDYARFLEIVGSVIRRYGWILHAYCLMPNHFHLLIEVRKPNVSEGMQLLNGGYAQWFNHRYGYDGHLFQGRFGARQIATEAHLAASARYVVLNPVRAGLCGRPRDWRWSSYLAVIGGARPPRFLATRRLLAWFGRDVAAARIAYVEFVHEALPRPP